MNFTDFEQMFSMGDDSDPLMMLVWIIPIIIFVFYGQQIQLLVTSGEIKKAIKIKTMKKKGNINVKTENIFPIIKQFLYSDHEIFLRELVSNAVDATQKMKTLKTIGELDADIKNLRVEVILNKEAKTITIRDNGIGMTNKELDKYINQIAFSGAEEFVNKYKDTDTKNSIIGHFGLGFYSAFMVAKEVEKTPRKLKSLFSKINWQGRLMFPQMKAKELLRKLIR